MAMEDMLNTYFKGKEVEIIKLVDEDNITFAICTKEVLEP